MWVRLTFENETRKAFAERKITSPKEGAPAQEDSINKRLTAVPQLLETGLLMPRGFLALASAIESIALRRREHLTGLDQLGELPTARANSEIRPSAFISTPKIKASMSSKASLPPTSVKPRCTPKHSQSIFLESAHSGTGTYTRPSRTPPHPQPLKLAIISQR